MHPNAMEQIDITSAYFPDPVYLEKGGTIHTENSRKFTSAIASYSAGTFGGVRAALHLKAIIGELCMPAISSMLPFPVIGNLFDNNYNPKNERVNSSTEKFLDEFVWYAETFKAGREKGVPY